MFLASALSRVLILLYGASECLRVSATAQFALEAPQHSTFIHAATGSSPNDSDFYQLKWPVRKVAIIGAGVSGLLAYRELADAGLDVRIFERDAIPGGVWHYTDEAPGSVAIPNEDVRIADYAPSLPPHGASMPYEKVYRDGDVATAERWRHHRAPHGVWKSLTSNVPGPLMHFNDHTWPPGTPWHLPQDLLSRYIRSVYSYYAINSNDNSPRTSYSTRVELIEKRFDADGSEQGWRLTLKKFSGLGNDACREQWWTEDFDAVVVATGTFNAPSVPNIPGLVEWRERFPESILHSREYRHPETFANQSVLVVGAGPSATGIAADLNPFVERNYLSFRRSKNSTTPLDFLQLLPQGVEVVVGIDRFHPSNRSVELADGTFLTDIDAIILSTGYRYTFPFLPQYHNSSIRLDEEGPRDQPQPLVTDGTHFRSLWREFVYIEEPTLGFLNMNPNTITWTDGENIARALARVWSGTARLPSQDVMWAQYRADIARRGGYGKHLSTRNHAQQLELEAFFSGWLNSEAYRFGGKRARERNPDYLETITIWIQAFFANRNPVKLPPGSTNATSRFGFTSSTYMRAWSAGDAYDSERDAGELLEWFTGGY